jgi:predicted pyridoxine 5'-phosphate oxidase superfamily flavin-nucleotide-binding protein
MAATFHDGEQALQRREGSWERMAQAGPRVIRDHMPDQHREFFALLPFLLAGSVDAAGQPWASVLAGPVGFAHSPAPTALRIDALPEPADPLAGALRGGMPIGLLGIQPHTRRRNRMNGSVAVLDEDGFTVEVGQSFGNCPKYIQPREPHYAPPSGERPPPETLRGLDEEATRLVRAADTFYIATAHPGAGSAPAFGVDVSHRGGPAGFVRAQGDTLAVPDYVGNGFFNTLGNLELEPRCGLLFIDPATGDLLQLAARGLLDWRDAPLGPMPFTPRSLRFEVTGGLRRRRAMPIRWT